jgi:hypothetical protein
VYYFIVIGLMFVVPIASGLIEIFAFNEGAFGLAPFLRWFVFWPVGVRLTLAGIRQVINPRYTAHTLLGLEGEDVLFVVRELGFANLGLGIIGIVAIAQAGWVAPAALAGAIFYTLDGLNHLRDKQRTRLQTVAMVSNLFVAIVLIVLLLPS